ncbi:hypothetical protein RIF29_38446 [Crotalaria pallida]|uniref:RNase H type-1 domain-containing protein n=1 Tax=Crotalaria pallida TaxID=3830 RepID=A0AAN9E4Q9_CROPI
MLEFENLIECEMRIDDGKFSSHFLAEESSFRQLRGHICHTKVMIRKESTVSSGLVLDLIYAIWWRRNKWVHDGIWQTFPSTLDYASGLAVPIETKSQIGPNQTAEDNVIKGVFHVSCDASLKKGIGLGVGFVVQNENGEFMAAATEVFDAVMDATVAEALALRWAMEVLTDIDITHASIFTDCQYIAKAWTHQSHGFSYLDEIISDCRDIASNFAYVQVLFRPRSLNVCADTLAKKAAPDFLKHFFVPDSQLVSPNN